MNYGRAERKRKEDTVRAFKHLTNGALANMLHCTPSHVDRLRRVLKLGHAPHPVRMEAQRRLLGVADFLEANPTMNDKQVGAAMGIPKKTILHLRTKLGIPARFTRNTRKGLKDIVFHEHAEQETKNEQA